MVKMVIISNTKMLVEGRNTAMVIMVRISNVKKYARRCAYVLVGQPWLQWSEFTI